MFVRDGFTGMLRIVAPGRSARLGPRPDGCPFCLGSERLTPPEIDRLEAEHGSWCARAVPNLFPLGVVHEVLVPTSRHATSLRELSESEWKALAQLWLRRLEAHRALVGGDWYAHLFVNDGAAAGASLEHTHAQLLAVPRCAQVSQLTDRVRGGAECAACLLAQTDDGLRVAEVGDWVVRAHASPRTGGGLLAVPRAHETELTGATAAQQLAGVLAALVHVAPLGAFNLWLVHDPVVAAHAYLELVPRTAVPAGLELALGIGVATLNPHAVAAQARARHAGTA